MCICSCMYVMVQRRVHSDFRVYRDAHRRSTRHKTFHFTMNSSLKCRICLFLSSQSRTLLHGSANGHVPPVPSLPTYFLWPHLRFNLGATHLLILTPFADAISMVAMIATLSSALKATSQTHSPDQTFCKLQSTTHSFSFNPLCLSFQLFLFSCN